MATLKTSLDRALGLYKLTDSNGETYTLNAKDDLTAIKQGCTMLVFDNGCIKRNGKDVAALTMIDGVRMIQLA